MDPTLPSPSDPLCCCKQAQRLSRDLDGARGEVSRLAAAVEQQRLQLQGSVPAQTARQQTEELGAQLGRAREAREEASRQAEATSHRLIELETMHARCGMEGSD